VDLSFEVDSDKLKVIAEVETVWKTGVEMEAMTAVSAALLNAYDMLKPLDKEMVVGEIKVTRKKGGKTQYREELERPLRTAVLVISDSTFAGTRNDKSGQVIKEFLESQPLEVKTYEILPDDEHQIRERVSSLVTKESYDLVITTGGTGFGPKDFTPEAIKPLFNKLAPGIVEKLRDYGAQRTPYAMLSREIAGTINQSLVITLPGSSKGAQESMQALFPGLLHIFPMLWSGGHAESKD